MFQRGSVDSYCQNNYVKQSKVLHSYTNFLSWMHFVHVLTLSVEDCLLDDFTSALNCKVKNFPMKYLGLPLGAHPRLRKTWKPTLQRIKLKFAAWKRRFLLFGGRLTLVISVLSVSPVYCLSIFIMLVRVEKEIG